MADEGYLQNNRQLTVKFHCSLNQSDGLHNELARLTKLEELDVKATDASKLKEVTLIALSITTTLLTSS